LMHPWGLLTGGVWRTTENIDVQRLTKTISNKVNKYLFSASIFQKTKSNTDRKVEISRNRRLESTNLGNQLPFGMQ